jgi:hypothetical protein
MYWEACQENFHIYYSPEITSADKHVLTLAMKFDIFLLLQCQILVCAFGTWAAHMYSTPSPAIMAWHFGGSITSTSSLVPTFYIMPCSFTKSENKDSRCQRLVLRSLFLPIRPKNAYFQAVSV